jgi:fused signal recognition particle receptor
MLQDILTNPTPEGARIASLADPQIETSFSGRYLILESGAVSTERIVAEAALARGIDNLIIDTAGRLHTKVNLMEELTKIQRVIQKMIPDAPHEVLLVLDATTGQNGLQQALRFTEMVGVTGIVLTKLDGTAKGGIAVAIQQRLGIPITYIGVGEGIDDLQPFNPREFVDALFSTE